jgi:general secretion pathway protein C
LASATIWIDELKSVQGLTRLFVDRGAQLVALILLLALGVDAALILTRALATSPAPPPPSLNAAPVLPRAGVNPTLQLATIINAHLFGSGAAASGGDAPATTMPLVLAGVIADPDPAKGVAIIGENAAGGKLYTVGAAIPGGAHLHAVYSDRVLLERNGGLETLMLPRTPMGSKSGIAAIPAPAPRSGPARDSATLLAGLVRVQPVFNQGKLQGYRIFPGGGRGTSAFSQLGLKPGDLIEGVNGTALDDATRAMEVLGTLSSSATATVTVSRNGQPQEVNLNLASLNLDADSADGAVPGQPAGAEQPTPPAPGTGPPFRGRMPLPSNLSAAPGAGAGSAGNINAAPGAGADTPAAPAAPAGSGSSDRDR